MEDVKQIIEQLAERVAILEAVAIMEAPEAFKTVKFIHDTAKPTAESKALSLSVAAFTHGVKND
ncbi:hypothetical protein G6K72_000842 [Salmonella enterica subsp. enterica serovar Rubislaw]|nr:hypothetical protein [Salmonella enterica subsp. enterica serovar Rubislaw]